MPARKYYRKSTKASKRNPYYGLKGRYLDNYKKGLAAFIKETAAKEHEKKQSIAIFTNDTQNAGEIVTKQLTDVTAGTDNLSRIGVEVTGSHFEILLNTFNKTNNDLFVRVSLLELHGRGGTVDIDSGTEIFQNPEGRVVDFVAATTEASHAAVMYPWDNKGSVKVLRERVLKIAKNNGGDAGSSRTIKWKIPWNKTIRYVSPEEQGALKQNRRVTLVVTAWAPNGGLQTDYEFTLDAVLKFYFKDS